MDIPREVASLLERGKYYLSEGKIDKAEKLFKEAAKGDPSPTANNNLAVCRFYREDYDGTLKALQTIPKTNLPNPFGHALASQALVALGRGEEAEAELEKAIADFESGMKTVVPAGVVDENSWREYTVIIKRAAGDLGKHHQVLELYRRWSKYHVVQEDRFLAGVAAFNLGRYREAISYWSGLPRPEWKVLDLYQRVTELVDTGVIPPFPLDYRYPYFYAFMERPAAAEEAASKLARLGSVRMITLGTLLRGPGTSESEIGQLGTLIYFGGEWGVTLAKQLLMAPGITERVKSIAAMALVELGVYKEGEPIPIVVNGETREIVIRRNSLPEEPDPELDAIVEEAIRLREAGKIDEAIEKLSPAIQGNSFYPPAMMTLANLLRYKGKLDEAENILLALEKAIPDEPHILFNLAGLYLQRKDPERARFYADRIDPRDPRGQDEEFQMKLRTLQNQIELLQLATGGSRAIMDAWADSYRKQQEDKPISLNLKLSRALRAVPVEWLSAALKAHGLDPKRYRKREDRARELEALLLDRNSLERSVMRLESGEKEVLRFILEKGGWAELSILTREFGSMEKDGFWWEEKPPISPQGKLWSKALLFIGKSRIDGGSHKVAVIPVELREDLADILSVSSQNGSA